jgi:hypothetical protein
VRGELRHWEKRVRVFLELLGDRLDSATREAIFTDLREGEVSFVVLWLGNWFGDHPELHLPDQERAQLISLAEAVDEETLARVSDAVAPPAPA